MLQYTTKQQLAAENLDLVKWVILDNININEEVYGFGYDDLFQEGCVHLCRAAEGYDGSSAKFSTYACVVVRNGLLYHCRRHYHKRVRFVSLDDCEAPPQSEADAPSDELTESDVVSLLESFKPEFSGAALRGIEALQLKVRGYSGAEIAAMYGVQPNLVGAWTSRASAKLRRNHRFLTAIGKLKD
jgi:RNA polymerase sigma factor (sigma-70 family)